MKRISIVTAVFVGLVILWANPASATFSNSGPKTLYSSSNGGGYDLRGLNPATKTTTPIQPGNGTDSVFGGRYSPGGKRVVYSSDVGGGDNEIWVADANGSNAHPVTSNTASDSYPTWSPDGKRIAYCEDGSLWVMHSDGSQQTMINPSTTDIMPVWSPDGSRIAFTEFKGVSDEIFTIAPSGTNKKRLTFGQANEQLGDWSPDGKHIVLSANDGAHTGIAILSLKGSFHYLIEDPTASLSTPVYTADGKHILYDRLGSNFDIYWAKSDGTAPHPLVANGTNNFLFPLP